MVLKRRKKFILVFMLFFLLFIFSVIFSIINMNNPNILNGILINGIDVSGLSREDAIDKLNTLINEKANNNIIISYSDSLSQEVSFENLEINYNVSEAINEAYSIGRSTNIFKNNFEILDLIINKKNINLNIDLNDDKLDNLMDTLSSNLPDKLIQSSYYIEDENLIITSGSSGTTIDLDQFKQKLNTALLDFSTTNTLLDVSITNAEPDEIDIDKIYNEIYKEAQNAYYEQNPFKIYSEVVGVSFDKDYATNLLNNYQDEYIIPLTIINPEITIDNLGIDTFPDILSTFTTKYDVTNTQRSTNLELAAEKINDTIISPGEEFSYNATVGARTIAARISRSKSI